MIDRRLLRLDAKLDDLVELAIRLKGGLLAVRDPLRLRNNAARRIAIIRPEKMPTGKVAKGTNKGRDRAAVYSIGDATHKDAQLVYERTGKKSNVVKALWSPTEGKLAQGSERVRSAVKLKGAFIPHLDRRSITSTTTASAFGGAGKIGQRDKNGVETGKLVRGYRALGYEVDHPEIDRQVRAAGAHPFTRAVMRQQLTTAAVPMKRLPRGAATPA